MQVLSADCTRSTVIHWPRKLLLHIKAIGSLEQENEHKTRTYSVGDEGVKKNNKEDEKI